MDINKIERKLKLEVKDFVRFQLIAALIFFKKETLTPSELEILTLLTITGETELGKFCNNSVKVMYNDVKMEEFAIKAQNIRNILTKMEKRGFIVKTAGSGRKSIKVHSDLAVYFEGNTLLNYQFLCIND